MPHFSEKIGLMMKFFHRYKQNKAAALGLTGFVVIVLFAVFAPMVAPYTPFQIAGAPFSPPSSDHLMGTDDLGRDVFSGIVYGTYVSLIIGSLTAITSTVIGITIGALSGFSGGKIDNMLMRFTEIFQVTPSFILALVFVSIFGVSTINVIIALGLVGWPSTARLVRGQFLSLKEREFVTAARAMGAGKIDMIFVEILPNALPPVIVNATLQMAYAILAESGLSFLGVSDPRVMTWGWMMGNAQRFLRNAPWTVMFPGLAVLFTVIAINLVGDGLNDALNPKLRER